MATQNSEWVTSLEGRLTALRTKTERLREIEDERVTEFAKALHMLPDRDRLNAE